MLSGDISMILKSGVKLFDGNIPKYKMHVCELNGIRYNRDVSIHSMWGGLVCMIAPVAFRGTWVHHISVGSHLAREG